MNSGKSVIEKIPNDTVDPKVISISFDTNAKYTINLMVDMKVGIGGDKWPAAEMFCKILLDPRFHDFFRNFFNKKNVIELGAGTGLVSILIDKLYGVESICVTDLMSHIPLIEKNLSLNRTKSCIAKAFDWYKDDLGLYDIILIFECVYNNDLYEPLIQALDRLSDKNTMAILGLTRLFARPKFFSLLKSYGYKYTMLPELSLPLSYTDAFNDRDVGIFTVFKE